MTWQKIKKYTPILGNRYSNILMRNHKDGVWVRKADVITLIMKNDDKHRLHVSQLRNLYKEHIEKQAIITDKQRTMLILVGTIIGSTLTVGIYLGIGLMYV